MADSWGEYKQAKLKDSNIAGIGSKRNRRLRKKAARTDRELRGAGEKPGLEIWRVENKRTRSGAPNFGIRRWPKEQYGQFYTGDSYLVLNTYIEPEEEKLQWDVHFWLGAESTQDEVGVAAYKAVEIDDLLDDGPIQHREVQGHESDLFQSYFENLTYLEGGIESGFNKVEPEEYEPRLLQVRITKKTMRAFEVKPSIKSLNTGDVFVLDAGTKVYCYIGEHSSPFERAKGGLLAHNVAMGRMGKAVRSEIDRDFWKILGGKPRDVRGPIDDDKELGVGSANLLDAKHMKRLAKGGLRNRRASLAAVKHVRGVTSDARAKREKWERIKLFRLSDATGELVFEQVGEGRRVPRQLLDSDDAFILDAGHQIFIWIGKGASRSEKTKGMVYAMKYVASEGRPKTLPITRIHQGQVNAIFDGCFFNAKGMRLPSNYASSLSSTGSNHRRSSSHRERSSRHHKHESSSRRRHESSSPRHHRHHHHHHHRSSREETEPEPSHRHSSHHHRSSRHRRHESDNSLYYSDSDDEVDTSRRALHRRSDDTHNSSRKKTSSSSSNGYTDYRTLVKCKQTGDYHGLDPTSLEKYLHPKDFEKVFGMSPKKYEKLPLWKQISLKKSTKLF